MTNAGSNAYECIVLGWIWVDTLVPICVSTKDDMAYSVFSFSPLGSTKIDVFFDTTRQGSGG